MVTIFSLTKTDTLLICVEKDGGRNMKELYLRFGEIPKNEKSVNFLKMSCYKNEDFSSFLDCNEYEEALDCLDEEHFENGVSVFKKDVDGLPFLGNLMQISSLLARIDNKKIFEIEADMVGEGNDGEPLVKNIKIIKQRKISKDVLLKKVLKTLIRNFKTCVKNNKEQNLHDVQIFPFYKNYMYVNINTGERKEYVKNQGTEWIKMPPYVDYCFMDWRFSCPVDNFDTRLGIK